MKIQKNNQRGFPLIEQMFVIAIIVILAAVAIPQYTTYIARTEVTSGVGGCRELALTVEEFIARYGVLPDTTAPKTLVEYSGLASLAAMAPDATDTMASCIPDAGGVLTITMGADVSADIAGLTFTMTPQLNDSWDYAVGTIGAKFLPKG